VTRRVLASTTSHKREPLLATLDVFSRLGLRDLDLNLHHFIEEGESVEAVAATVAAGAQRVWVVSGGWCDFFRAPPDIDVTFQSVARQVDIADRLDVGVLRLFFGHLPRASYSPAVEELIAGNLRRLSDRHETTMFVFENHDGASLVPEICRAVLQRVDRPNIRMNFDPVNFARAGFDPEAARAAVQPFIAHVHLKGLDRGEYCEFGAGDLDLTPVLQRLVRHGYAGDFTVEYEGRFDGTLRLYRSVERARTVAASIE
jgi:sugar phosphate isomerase/epimerase